MGAFLNVSKKHTNIFTPKPGKDDYNKEKAYRMLTLSPCIAKIYNSIFAEKFYKWLEKIDFDPDQFAHRKYHS